jgi:hypothetical protein
MLAALPASAAGAATTTSTSTTTTIPAPNPHPVVLATIVSDQVAVITKDHQAAITSAQLALNNSQARVSVDQQTLDDDRARAATEATVATVANRRLSADRGDLLVATTADRTARNRLAGDRNRLHAIVLGAYTGALTGPQPPSLQSLESGEEAVLAAGEVTAVARVVVKTFQVDTGSTGADDRRDRQLTIAMAADQGRAATAQRNADAAASGVLADTAARTAAQRRLASTQRQLAKARTARQAALAAIVGAASSANGLSVMGPPALDAAQLADWFNAQGFVDLTPATVTTLANWYLHEGAAMGVRGDVAFAQAVLETGGFSSPDAIGLNNYAGIGHCDTCAAGWGFPSPETGVLGQVQLLRIFADSGPAPPGAPPPVLPALTPSREGRRGCCPTWESLTGTWATDPLYGSQILLIYQQMLSSFTPSSAA